MSRWKAQEGKQLIVTLKTEVNRSISFDNNNKNTYRLNIARQQTYGYNIYKDVNICCTYSKDDSYDCVSDCVEERE